jgi:hypothetical protein
VKFAEKEIDFFLGSASRVAIASLQFAYQFRSIGAAFFNVVGGELSPSV